MNVNLGFGDNVIITTIDGNIYSCEVVGINNEQDSAILKVNFPVVDGKLSPKKAIKKIRAALEEYLNTGGEFRPLAMKFITEVRELLDRTR